MASTTKTRTTSQGERRPDIERWLDEHGVSWTYEENFALDSIDRDKSLANQARLGEPLDEDLVAQYRDAMRNEQEFPALVVARGSAKARAVTIDGNHRYEAARLEEIGTYGTYVVSARPNSNAVTAMTYEANTRHGKATTLEERVQQALWLVDNQKLSQERAAAAVNVPVSALRSRLDKVRADRRADEAGVKRALWDPMPAATRTKLNVITTDEGFKAAAELAAQAQLSVREVDDVVGEVNGVGRSAAKQVAAVRKLKTQYRSRIAELAGGKRSGGRFTPARRFTLAVSNLLALPEDFATNLAEQIPADERATAAEQARAGAERLAALADALAG